MTKSTITRERIQQIFLGNGPEPSASEERELARIALAAMDSELVIPDEMTAEQAYEIGDYHGDPVDVFARGANWMRQHIIKSSLSVKNQEESATKWWHGLHNEIKGRGRRHEGDFTPDISMSTEEIIDAINKRRAAMLNGGKS